MRWPLPSSPHPRGKTGVQGGYHMRASQESGGKQPAVLFRFQNICMTILIYICMLDNLYV